MLGIVDVPELAAMCDKICVVFGGIAGEVAVSTYICVCERHVWY